MAEVRSRIRDVSMIVLLLGSVAIAFWYEAVDKVANAALAKSLEWIDLALVIFFVAEWIMRVRTNPEGKAKYALRNSWELLGMIPLILPLPSFLRALRMLRIIRILRVFGTVGKKLGVFERLAKESGMNRIFIAAGGVTLIGALLVWVFERDTNPGLATFSDALWWAIVTVTTVGFGDRTPESASGRFIAALMMVVGIGIVGFLSAGVASVLVKDDQEEAAAEEAARDLVGELERLTQLREAGRLTEQEFTAAKAKVIG